MDGKGAQIVKPMMPVLKPSRILTRKRCSEMERGSRKNPSVAQEFVHALPFYDVPTEYVLFKPLSLTEPDEMIKSVIFLANPDQISVLSIMANYHRGQITDGVVVAAGASGCQAFGVCTYNEEKSEKSPGYCWANRSYG